jgi:hypothetical protein
MIRTEMIQVDAQSLGVTLGDGLGEAIFAVLNEDARRRFMENMTLQRIEYCDPRSRRYVHAEMMGDEIQYDEGGDADYDA